MKYKEILEEIEKSLKLIHYPLCCLEKYVFDYESDLMNEKVQNIHNGFMQIITAINEIRKMKVKNND